MKTINYYNKDAQRYTDETLSNVNSGNIGKYGRMYRIFLKEKYPMIYSDLILTDELMLSHLEAVTEFSDDEYDELKQDI